MPSETDAVNNNIEISASIGNDDIKSLPHQSLETEIVTNNQKDELTESPVESTQNEDSIPETFLEHLSLENTDIQQEQVNDEHIPERDILTVSFGPKVSWFVRCTDGLSAWEGLPPTLHAKLAGRLPSLPGVKTLSISEIGSWAVVFEDGSFATSGISVVGKLEEALQSNALSEVKSLNLAPSGGWLLTREDGSFAYERLPSGLAELLSRRIKSDPPIEQFSISGFGGWFVRFADGECEWESLPKPLEKFLIQMIRKGDPNLVISLSPTDGHSYFISIGDTVEWAYENQKMRETLECITEDEELLKNVNDIHTLRSCRQMF